MKVAGIIAEYNPFHNGHAYLAEKAREAGFSHVVAVMSGNFVQRGEPALMHHSARTRAALECGIDLVLQLPSVYAVSSAQSFARAGAEILNGTGCIDALVFGSECGSTEKIISAADAVYSEEIKPMIAQELEKGISFASARENALRRINPECADIIQSPNNILGVEYAAALKRINSSIEAITFARVGAEHDSAIASEKNASASLIRERIRRGEAWESFVPPKAAEAYRAFPVADIGGIENAILYKIRTTCTFSSAPDVSEGIENRILSAAKQATTLEELYSLAKTKRYSHARIRRIILNHFLTVTADDLRIPVPYIRVMGFNSNGAQLLREMKKTAGLPVITKAADIAALGENAQKIFSLECAAGDIFALCTAKKLPCGTEKDYKPIII
ncbi:MAG: nucleotidyltransferase family protein [Clostridia bacterium]|nr:nucleotidyltransferase family protein [Clostridia bacterium]